MKLTRILKSYYIKYLNNKYVQLLVGKGWKIVLENQFANSKANCSFKIGDESIFEGLFIFDRENAIISVGERTFIVESSKRTI